MGKQGGIDLAELHPEAADFHLAVRAAEALERAVGQPADEVAGAVVARQAGQDGLDEAFRGELRPLPVSCGEAGAGDEEFAGDAGRQRGAIIGGDEDTGVGDRLADADALRIFRDLPEGGPDGGLGGAVEVPKLATERAELAGEGQIHRFAAAEDGHAGRSFPAGVEQHPPGGRGRLHHIGAGGGDAGGERDGIAGDFPNYEIHRTSGDQRQENFQRGDVERHGGQGEQPLAFAEAGFLAHRQQEVRQRAMGHDHALGLSGGAGGVEDVGGVAGLAGRGVGVLAAFGHRGVEHDGVRAFRQSVDEARRNEDVERALVFQDQGEALGWIGSVERHVGGPRFPRGKQGDGQQQVAL